MAQDHQATLFPLDELVPVRGHVPLDAVAVRLARLTYAGVECFRVAHTRAKKRLDSWSSSVRARLAEHGVEVEAEELERLHEYVSSALGEPARAKETRADLVKRLCSDPALPAGASIAYFKNYTVKEGVQLLEPTTTPEPTVTFTLDAPLHFRCHGKQLKVTEQSPLTARIRVRSIPGEVGTHTQELERFALDPSARIEHREGCFYLKYDSLNKACAGIFRRLHLHEGKQNSNRSIYYQTAYMRQDERGDIEYRSFWGIRDEVLRGTWKCPR